MESRVFTAPLKLAWPVQGAWHPVYLHKRCLDAESLKALSWLSPWVSQQHPITSTSPCTNRWASQALQALEPSGSKEAQTDKRVTSVRHPGQQGWLTGFYHFLPQHTDTGGLGQNGETTQLVYLGLSP